MEMGPIATVNDWSKWDLLPRREFLDACGSLRVPVHVTYEESLPKAPEHAGTFECKGNVAETYEGAAGGYYVKVASDRITTHTIFFLGIKKVSIPDNNNIALQGVLPSGHPFLQSGKL